MSEPDPPDDDAAAMPATTSVPIDRSGTPAPKEVAAQQPAPAVPQPTGGQQTIALNRASAMRDIRNGVLVGGGFLVFSFILSLISSGFIVIATLPIIAAIAWIGRGLVKLAQNPIPVGSDAVKAPPVEETDKDYEGW